MVLTYWQPRGRLIVNIFRTLTCIALLTGLLVGCGTTYDTFSYHRDSLAADAMADRGEYEAALEAYTELSARATTQMDLQHLQVRSAYMLEQMGRAEDALVAYARIYTRPTHPYDDNAGRAIYRAGRVYRDLLDQPETAIDVWLNAVRLFPDSMFATDSLNQVERYYKKDERFDELLNIYASLYVELRDRDIAHALAYKSAVILDDDLDRCFEALELYDLIIHYFPRGGYIDNAIWRTGLCYRRHDRRDEEYRLLLDFVQGREISVLLGDYDYEQYTDAFLRLAEMHEEDGDLRGAIRYLRTFQKTFPLSLQADDIQFEIIEKWGQLGEFKEMRRYADELIRLWPESRYVSRVDALIEEAERGHD